MDHKKIIFHIQNLSHGGAERVVVNLAQRFASDGYEVCIATEVTAQTEYELPEGIRRLEVGVEKESASRLINLQRKKKLLRKCLKKERPDLVLAFGKSANFRAVAAAKGICPVIVSVRNDPKKHYAGTLNRLFLKRYMNKADGCVFQTQEARGFFDPVLQEKSRIILNPINDKYLQVSPAASRRPVIVNAARIAEQKNQRLLIRAFAAVSGQFPQYSLLLYGADSGDGTLEQLQKEIDQLGVSGRVRMMGNCDRLEKEIADAALFVLSSDYEGMPNALMEAMAMGIPCIATDCPCGGPRTLIKDGDNGLLVPVKDEERLAQAMEKMLRDEEYAKRLGDAALDIRKRAESGIIYGEWKEYTEELLRKTSAGKRDAI